MSAIPSVVTVGAHLQVYDRDGDMAECGFVQDVTELGIVMVSCAGSGPSWQFFTWNYVGAIWPVDDPPSAGVYAHRRQNAVR